eukprot:CAMPEP_0177336530 /NCGR_PEP_ID=MMETSP0368-20130122/23837_1 /TAXON_ID=447022 ORGANISM="Scrippsiella hangoei-like, Strain SHHI-4" /NCGR_SAMPLE_ID=MMETSP0368 /ASSEMBLY_ACC=CAM_ASM_000363 /LENGTH=81 /DNA_ID=CAMNT_0018797393 /DNA_START=312 /DNA_END=555 /DNA_ORIENTATION=-
MSSHPSTWSPPGTTIEELGEDMGREEHELKQAIAAAQCTLWHTPGLCAANTMSSCPGTMVASWYHIEELGEDMGRKEHELK